MASALDPRRRQNPLQGLGRQSNTTPILASTTSCQELVTAEQPEAPPKKTMPGTTQILTIFTTVGFGDMSAFTTAETLYVDWAMLLERKLALGILE